MNQEIGIIGRIKTHHARTGLDSHGNRYSCWRTHALTSLDVIVKMNPPKLVCVEIKQPLNCPDESAAGAKKDWIKQAAPLKCKIHVEHDCAGFPCVLG